LQNWRNERACFAELAFGGNMTKEQLIAGLNEDLAAEWGTILRYTYQSGKVVGLRGAELREIFDKEIPDELGHAKYLTDVVADLGGDPTTKPKEFGKPDDLKAMIELDLKMELSDVENYTAHSKMAGELGMTELKVKLEEMAADESKHARELHRILKGL
jgi:bacterioferritin